MASNETLYLNIYHSSLFIDILKLIVRFKVNINLSII